MGAKIGSLNIDLTIDSARFMQGVDQVQGRMGKLNASMKKVGAAIQGAFVASGAISALNSFRAATRSAVDAVGNLGEEAAALGVTTSKLQELRFAATQFNLTSAQMDDAIGQLTRRMGDAAAGVGEPKRAFEALGLSLYDAQGKMLDAGEMLPKIADALSKIEDPATRAAITVDLFGRSGQRLAALLDAGSAGIERLAQKAREMGIVISDSQIAKADEVADKLAVLDAAIEAQNNAKLVENADSLYKFESSLAELKFALIDGSNELQRWVDRFDAFNQQNAEDSREFYSRIGALAEGLPERLSEMANSAIKHMGRMVEGIRVWLTTKLNAVWDGVTERIERVRVAFFDLWDKVTRRSYVPDMVDDIAAEMARLDAVMVDPATRATEKTARAFRDMASDVGALLDRLFPKIAEFRQLTADRALLEAARDAGMISSQTEAEARFRLRPGARTPATVSEGLLNTGPLAEAEQVREAAKAASDALAGLVNKSRDAFTAIERFASNAFSELGFQLRGLVTGAQSLGDALRNLGLRMAEQLFDSAWSSLGRSIGIPGFATGTMSAPGGLALVGERGPELVNLPRGSRVFTNSESRRMMSGGERRGDQNFYITTPDADSFQRSSRQVQRTARRRLGM